jgi:hypothetical protein
MLAAQKRSIFFFFGRSRWFFGTSEDKRCPLKRRVFFSFFLPGRQSPESSISSGKLFSAKGRVNANDTLVFVQCGSS